MTCPQLVFPLSACLALAAIALGCGIKGPPLAPLVIVPARVASVSAERFDDQVFVSFQVPSENTDGSAPADLDRVEVYALTTQPVDGRDVQPPFDDWFDAASLVATILVRPPGATEPNRDTVEGSSEDDASEVQGADVTVVEHLTPDTFVLQTLEDEDEDEGAAEANLVDEPPRASPLVGPALPRPPRRTYVVRGVSLRGREGSPSSRVSVPLTQAPDPPSAPTVTYTESEIELVWNPPTTVRLPIQEPATDDVLAAEPIVESPTPSAFQIYDVTEDAAKAEVRRPQPLNSAPQSDTTHRETRITFGVERCFAARTVDSVDGMEIRSRPSVQSCVMFVDTFPPKAPGGVIAVASDAAISLVWDANTERDLAGYMVLRGRVPGATLAPLTAAPIEETIYRDVTVDGGVSYEYAVQAVDRATPPNLSPMSERVVERAR